MRKRIKARVKQKELVSLEYAREIYRKGKRLAEYAHIVDNGTVKTVHIHNISYLGKLYFVVYFDCDGFGDVKECIELA